MRMYSQGIANVAEIFVDRQTGVNYLLMMSTKAYGGLTVLVDEDGKPVITPPEELK